MKNLSRKAWRRKQIHHFSPTGAISKFTDCPLQFWFYKIAKVEDSSDEKPYLVFGNALHAAHETALNLKAEGSTLSCFKQEIQTSFNNTFDKLSGKVPNYSWGKDGKEGHLIMGRSMVSMLIDRYDTMPIKPLFVEKEYSLPFEKDILLNCRIDLVAEFTDDWKATTGQIIHKGDILIIDHKSASQKYKPNAVNVSDQLTFYALVIREVEKIRESGVMFQAFMKYKAPEIQDYLSTRSNHDVDIITEKMHSMLKIIDQGIFYPTFKPDVCSFCDYTSLCPSFATEKRRIEYENELALKQEFKLSV